MAGGAHGTTDIPNAEMPAFVARAPANSNSIVSDGDRDHAYSSTVGPITNFSSEAKPGDATIGPRTR
jgi:hypothetical protein